MVRQGIFKGAGGEAEAYALKLMHMDYWHNILAERSWEILQKIKSEFRFVLIGGWAVYLWTKASKSRDIDIIVDFETLSFLKTKYDLRKNQELKNYEIRQDEIDIDVYVAHYSRLAMPLEGIDTAAIEGFEAAKPEYLLILKQGAEMDRKESEKGEKDRIDILSLLFNCDIDFSLYYRLLKKHRLEHFLRRLISVTSSFKEHKYLDMTPRQLKLKKQKVLERLRKL